MDSHLKMLALLVILVCAVSAESGNILVKQDPNGRTIYYNIPSHSSGDPQGIYYSEHVQDYQAMIEKISPKYGVDPELVKAVIQVESNYDQRAVSRKGAKGLMQLMPDTAARYGVRSIFDPSQNIEGGVRYLKDLIALFNSDLRLTLAAYNAGENCVQKINDVPDYVETQNYVRKVLALYNGEMSYTPYSGGGRVGTVTYWKFVDEKGVTHYSAEPVNVANATKVSFSYAW
ncbi:MAG TPA: transglycosylase SLT domain-containing protein [Acidobacteriota bacterium]|nr:transglycosylase SLT domain-containing protein [Acidobacteriota bacterium]